MIMVGIARIVLVVKVTEMKYSRVEIAFMRHAMIQLYKCASPIFVNLDARNIFSKSVPP